MGQTKGSASQLAFVYVGTVVGAGFATDGKSLSFSEVWLDRSVRYRGKRSDVYIFRRQNHDHFQTDSRSVLSGIEHIFIRPVHRPCRKHVYDVYIAGSDLCHAVRSGGAVS